MVMLGLLLVLGTMLVAANRWLVVVEDPRVEAVDGMLPQTNCGGCGFPGCRAFANALVAGQVLPGKCTVASTAQQTEIANYLGVTVGRVEKRVARLACAGGSNVARHRARYRGRPTCAAAALVAGGGKSCFWGCLGWGDCQRSCSFNAIRMDEHGLPVVDEDLCTACGDCVVACPKDLFSLQGMENRLWVACRSQEAGEGVLEQCEVGCTACGRCAMDAPHLIQMQGNLPVVDYRRQDLTAIATERCPTGAIVWLSPAGPVKGSEAGVVVRHRPLPDQVT